MTLPKVRFNPTSSALLDIVFEAVNQKTVSDIALFLITINTIKDVTYAAINGIPNG